jgi:hypothetical protein
MELPDVVRPFLDHMPGRLFVGGEWIESENGAQFEVENPDVDRCQAAAADHL